jgi:hypothetical protein
MRIFLGLNFALFTLLLFGMPLGLQFGVATGEVDPAEVGRESAAFLAGAALMAAITVGLWRHAKWARAGAVLACWLAVAWLARNWIVGRGAGLVIAFTIFYLLALGALAWSFGARKGEK